MKKKKNLSYYFGHIYFFVEHVMNKDWFSIKVKKKLPPDGPNKV